VILGLGVGSLKEEFDLLGVPFDDRGPRGDDALRALRAALPTNEPTYDGEFYSFGGLTVDPCALQPHMPFWIGGRTKRSLRRAVTLADGWCPFNVPVATAADWLQTWELPDDFEVVLMPEQPLDPVGDPRPAAETLRTMAAAGTTTLSAVFIAHSLEHYLEQIHALAEMHELNEGQTT
jgi:alkanesulfonate monooxygenase SsuD/methylene tetrahydromethanopterin reductase-like flavin-dependent oxidoreductase (luciferase family)